MGLAQMLLATSRMSHAQQKQLLVNVETDWVSPLGETHCAPVNHDVTNTFFFPCTPDHKNYSLLPLCLRASVALGNRLLLLRRSQDRCVRGRERVISNHVGRPRGMRMSFLGESAPATAALHDNFCATRNTCRQHFRQNTER